MAGLALSNASSFSIAEGGGLVEHSMKVYEILKTKTEDNDSVKIISLLHDMCKINYYKTDYRNVKNNGVCNEKEKYLH